jgi:hypothetical protein
MGTIQSHQGNRVSYCRFEYGCTTEGAQRGRAVGFTDDQRSVQRIAIVTVGDGSMRRI